jgi:hypothetical protein
MALIGKKGSSKIRSTAMHCNKHFECSHTQLKDLIVVNPTRSGRLLSVAKVMRSYKL